MEDIVQRLRRVRGSDAFDREAAKAGADEIERLRSALKDVDKMLADKYEAEQRAERAEAESASARATLHHAAEDRETFLADIERLKAELEALRKVVTWSWIRSVMAQGTDIYKDYVAGNHANYEEYAARLDAAASERLETAMAREGE